jgi:starvation-inducible DNA-binding protein
MNEELVTNAYATYRKPGFSRKENAEIALNLNRVLANYNVHYQKMRNFHWNIKGQNFFDLHTKFEDLYTRAFHNIDQIAERIRVFGESPLSTMREYLELSDIEEVDVKMNASEMVKETLSDFEHLLSSFVNTANNAAEVGDVGTVSLLDSMIKHLEKDHWMLTSWNSN